MSALVTSEISRLFVKTLTTDEKYSRRYIQIFWEQLQTPLSQKGKAFCQFFIAFLKCALNLQHSEKNKKYPSLIITEQQQLQRPLSQKGTSFFWFFTAFLKCAWNLKHSEKKEKYPSPIITEIIASERDVYLSVEKVLLQHTNRSSTC